MSAVCRGCWALGTACGHCSRCRDTALEGARILQAQVRDQRAIARNAVLRELGDAMKKFAPDLARELADRVEYAKLTPDQRLDRFIEIMRQ